MERSLLEYNASLPQTFVSEKINEKFIENFINVIKFIKYHPCIAFLNIFLLNNWFNKLLPLTMHLNMTLAIDTRPKMCNSIIFEVTAITSDTNKIIRKECKTYKEKLVVLYESSLDTNASYFQGFGECDMFFLQVFGLEVYRMTSPFLVPRNISTINFPAQEWLPKRDKLPNLRGRTLKLATFHCPLSVIFDREGDTNVITNFDGIEITILNEMSRYLNFTWKLYEITDDNKWTNKGPNGTSSGGMMGALTRGIAHIGICSIWISHHQYPLVDFTPPWGQMRMKFLVIKNKPEEKWRSIFLPFNLGLWISLAAVVLLQAFIIWGFSAFKSGSLVVSILYTLGQLILAHPGVQSSTKAVKTLVLFMSVFALLVTSLYSGSIVSRLTAPAQSPQIDTLRQMVEHNIYWGKSVADHDPSNYMNVKNKWHREVIKRYRYVPSAQELGRLAVEGKFGIISEFLDPDYVFVDQPVDTKIYPYLHLTKETIISYEIAMALPKDSILTPFAALFLERLKSSGLILKWRKAIVRRRGKDEVKKLLIEEIATAEAKPLTLPSLQGAFYILAFSWGLATVTFLIEVLLKSSKSFKIIT